MNSGKRFKLFCVVAYAVVLGGFSLAIALTSDHAPSTKVRQTFAKDHVVTDADIASADRDQIVGRRAIRDFKTIGEDIRPADVSPPIDLPPAGGIAILVPVTGREDWLDGEVTLCRGATVLAPSTRVISSRCDGKGCLASVLLPKGTEPKSSSEPRGLAIKPKGDCADQEKK